VLRGHGGLREALHGGLLILCVVLITLILCTVGGLCLAALLLNLLLFEGQHVAVDLLGVGRGPKNLQRIVPQDIDPRADVRRVLAGVVTDPEFVAQDHAGDFGS
jgi:hypothetical protein